MSRFDYADPGTDPIYCDRYSEEPDEDRDEPDENPREKGDDDGVEYGDPRDARDEQLEKAGVR